MAGFPGRPGAALVREGRHPARTWRTAHRCAGCHLQAAKHCLSLEGVRRARVRPGRPAGSFWRLLRHDGLWGGSANAAQASSMARKSPAYRFAQRIGCGGAPAGLLLHQRPAYCAVTRCPLRFILPTLDASDRGAACAAVGSQRKDRSAGQERQRHERHGHRQVPNRRRGRGTKMELAPTRRWLRRRRPLIWVTAL